MSPHATCNLAVWDACSLGANGLVFFWSGAACINFLIRWVCACLRLLQLVCCTVGLPPHLPLPAARLSSPPHAPKRDRRSGGILSNSAWSWAAIPLIYLALVALRTGSYALFNATAFAWLKESESRGDCLQSFDA